MSNDSKPRNARKVRFDLPAAHGEQRTSAMRSPKFDHRPSVEKKVHGTGNYINGTLNFSTADYATLANCVPQNAVKNVNAPKTITFRNQFTNDASAKNARKNCSIDQQYWDNAVNRRGILLHVSAANQPANSITFRKNKSRRYMSIFVGPSKYFRRNGSKLFSGTKTQPFPNQLELPTTKPSNDDRNAFEQFSYKLISIKPRQQKHDRTEAADFDERALSIVRNAFNCESDQQCSSEQLSEILQLAHRWQSTAQPVPASDSVSTQQSSTSVEFRTLKKLDVQIANSDSGSESRRFVHAPPKFHKMNKDKLPLVTTLLRASRSQDDEKMRQVLEAILQNGMTEAELNSVDCSGRTALSYMCSRNTTHFLEGLLQVPAIDINKPDNELNTPLHYAAECGHLGAIRLLLAQNKLDIDAKNIFGFTPLMKAAIQGHIRCAKTLLFAGSSPIEIDYKRQLKAEQWARFCGRHTCAELIEKWSKTRNFDKGALCQSKDQDGNYMGRMRASSTVQALSKVPPMKSERGIRSKISKVFNFVSRDKSSNQNRNNNNNNNNTKESSSTKSGFCKRGFTMLSRSDGFLNKSVVRPLEVPKLEVTSPHNQELIRKYEKRYSLGNNENAKPPALPPRRSSKQIM